MEKREEKSPFSREARREEEGEEKIEISNLENTIGEVIASYITGWTFLWLIPISAALASISLLVSFLTKTDTGEIKINAALPIALLIFFVSTYVVITGFLRVRPIERPVVERFGSYWKILKPGPNILIRKLIGIEKLLGIEGMDVIVNTYDTRAKKLPLFEDISQDPNKTIDFLDSAEDSVDFGVWYVIVDAYRVEYFTADIETFIKDITENIAKRVFGETTVDDAIENKFSVEETTNDYLSKPMEKLAKEIDENYLKILKISRETAEKLSTNMLLKIAGIRINAVYFNDIGLSAETVKKRKQRFDTRQDQIIQEKQIKVEDQKIEIKERQKIQRRKEDEGIRLGLEAIAGKPDENEDRRMSIREVAKFKVDMAKYGKGVDEISEINIGGGESSSAESVIAKLAAIAGKTAQKSGATGTKEKKKKPKEPEEELEKPEEE